MEKPLQVFCCYAHEDRSFLLELMKRLIPLRREGLITTQSDVDISPGEDWEQEIRRYLDTAHIILLLISPDFLASDYCYSNEMVQALERHSAGDARIIPIILRPVNLQRAPFNRIQPLPKDAKPVRKWANRDEAFLDVVNGIEKVIGDLIPPIQQPYGTLRTEDLTSPVQQPYGTLHTMARIDLIKTEFYTALQRTTTVYPRDFVILVSSGTNS